MAILSDAAAAAKRKDAVVGCNWSAVACINFWARALPHWIRARFHFPLSNKRRFNRRRYLYGLLPDCRKFLPLAPVNYCLNDRIPNEGLVGNEMAPAAQASSCWWPRDDERQDSCLHWHKAHYRL